MVRKTSTFILLALILISSFVIMNISSPVEAVGGNAKVYIICLPNVGGSALSTPYDPSKTRDGAIEALSFKEDNNVPRVHPKFGKTPPFFSVDYVVVTSWSLYKTIIESPDYKGIIIINTHGEKLPIPSGYNSPSEWVDKISDAMLKRRVTWVHTAGYPFYYYYYQNGGEGTWGEDGFKYFMGKIGKGSVNCETPSGHESDKNCLSAAAEDTLKASWNNLAFAFEVECGKPLKYSDFLNYTILTIWGSTDYMTGAVIAYAKPSERCTDRLGSGAYVHIGTNKTYTGGDPPIETEAEKWRGFVGATAAVWTETQAFGPTGANNTYTPSPGYLTEAGLIVTPRISCYSRDSVNNIFHVYLGFDIYGVMKTNYTSESGSVEFWLSAVSGSSSGCDLMMYTNSSKNGYNAGKTTFSGLTVVSVVKTIAGTVLFLAPFILPETSPIICILQPIGGVMLISDWVLLLPSEVIGYSGVDDYSQDVCFLCNPRKFKTTSGGFNYYEFESTFSIELRVPISWQQWTVVPLNWAINFEDNAQNVAVVASGGISVALFNTYPHITKNFVSTVFFEDFEDDMSGWSVGDSNSLDGYDYWGISDGEGHYGNMLYCAEVGTHSRRGEQPNTDLNDGYGYYDTNMEAYLTRSFDLRPFKNAWLRYDLSYQMLLDKNLTVEYYNGTWHTPKTYTGGGSDSPEIPIPTSTREIRFIFSSDNEFDPFYDGFGAYLDNIEIRAELSNDAGSMADAADGFGSATQISISDSYNNYAGYLGSDEDWYQFYINPTQISNHKQICVWLNQPSNSIFNITLYDNNTTIKASPVNSGPALSYVLSSSDQAGWWRIQILPVQGFGQYNFDIQLKQTYQLTVKTMKIEGDAEVINVNIWVDGVRYRSPVHITLTEGTHIVEAEPYFYRRVYWLYMFDHWEDDGSTNNTRIISAEDDINLTAYYHEFYCPTLFVWNGSEYVYEALLNIHAETDITVQHQIQQTLVLDGIFYKLQLRELDNFTSHIDQVKLYAVDQNGEWHTCPLTIAKLNGTYLTLKLLFDDDRRVDLYPSQIIDLKFLPSIPYHETAHFVFEINGYNRKLP